MNEDIKKQISDLTKKAASCADSNEALKFSQAALNLAHVVQCVCLNPDK